MATPRRSSSSARLKKPPLFFNSSIARDENSGSFLILATARCTLCLKSATPCTCSSACAGPPPLRGPRRCAVDGGAAFDAFLGPDSPVLGGASQAEALEEGPRRQALQGDDAHFALGGAVKVAAPRASKEGFKCHTERTIPLLSPGQTRRASGSDDFHRLLRALLLLSLAL